MEIMNLAAGDVLGCQAERVKDVYRVVIDLLGPTADRDLSCPEWFVRVYDRGASKGRMTTLPLMQLDDETFVRISATERQRRLDGLANQ